MIFPNKYRKEFPTIPVDDPTAGFFRIPHQSLAGLVYLVHACITEEWEHLGVIVVKQDRCPTWEEMCYIKSLFWDPEETVIQFHPPESENISNHPYCLHLWKPVHGIIPLPPSDMIGIK